VLPIQEDLHNKSIALSTKSTKMTLQILYKLVKKAKNSRTQPKFGMQTVKQLARQNRGMSNIEITNDNIKGFERFARKYGVDFALKKDGSKFPPTWFVFFKAQDADAITAAFGEFTKSMMKKAKGAPSVIAELGKLKELIKNAVINTVKNKERGGFER